MSNNIEAGCTFCKIIRQEVPGSVILRTDRTITFTSLDGGYPLIAPIQHIENKFDPKLTLDIAAEMGRVAMIMTRVVMLNPAVNAVTEVTNNGADSGQEIMHLHTHIMPRSFGDRLVRISRSGHKSRTELDDLASLYRDRFSALGLDPNV